MKFNLSSLHQRTASQLRYGATAVVSLALACATIACSRDYVSDYVYAISASNGSISGFSVDYQSGVLTQLAGSPFASTLTNPVTLVAAPSGKYVYAIGGSQSSAVESIAVGTDGKLFGQKTYNITGTYPTAAAIDPLGNFLYVTYTYQSGFSPASPGPGGLTVFPISQTDGSLGTAVDVKVGNRPVAVAAAPSNCSAAPIVSTNAACTLTGSSTAGKQNLFVYVVTDETSTSGMVYSYAQNSTTGGLVPTAAVSRQVGVTPSAIAADPTGRFIYITDKTTNQILGYSLAGGTTGDLTPQVANPYSTGLYPVAVTIDPRGKYLYTANFNASTVSSYSINQADGSLGGSAGSGSFSTQTNPTCVTIEPALGIYLYTSNSLGGSISGGQLSPNTGQLNAVTNSFFEVGALPSCVVSVANGSHATFAVYP